MGCNCGNDGGDGAHRFRDLESGRGRAASRLKELLAREFAGIVGLHMNLIALVLPARADNCFPGKKPALYVFAVLAAAGAVRSLIHVFAPDGGAGSIAGMDLPAGGAGGIVFAFALWGTAQLVYAVIQLTVAIRYRSLVPFLYLLLIFETLLRMLVGHLKPAPFLHTPPGAIGNYVVLPLAAAMFALSIWK